jgi:SET domain-containing protein
MSPTELLLHELANNTYVALRPSPVAGIGVFAIRPIRKGCRDMFSKPNPAEQWQTLTHAQVKALPEHARALVENFCLFDETVYYVPQQGFKALDISLFLNHADVPNIQSIDDGNYFEALRDISAGEELFLDYGKIVDCDE